MPVSKQFFDAVIVGSEASGGWVAKQLTEQGMSVLMLELFIQTNRDLSLQPGRIVKFIQLGLSGAKIDPSDLY